MSLLYDDPGLAAVVLTRIAAEESEGPGEMTGGMSEHIADLVERNGPPPPQSWQSHWHASISSPWTPWPDN